jgi:hypothetical protein
MPLNLTGCGVVSACSIDFSGAATSPSTAGIGYGVFGYSGVGLGFGSAASGPGQGMAFFTCGDYERMRIISSGNVGIGTTAPSYKLDIGGSGPSIGLSSTSATGYNEMYFSRNTSTVVGYIGVGVNAAVTANGDDFVIQNRLSTGNLVLHTNTTERMRITNNGNVGIGCTVPQTRLHISDTANFGNATFNARSDGGYLIFQEDSTTRAYLQWGLQIGGSAAGNYLLLTNDESCGNIALQTRRTDGTINSCALVVACTGNIGIGTSAPIGLLEVRGLNRCISNDGLLQVNSSNSVAIDLGGSLTFGGTYVSTSVTEFAQISGRKETATSGEYGGYLDFATRPHLGLNCSRIRITSIGNVGINTTTPGSYKLNVNGAFYAAGSSKEYKTSICEYNTDSCMFMKLKPVTYDYKEEWKHLGKQLKSGTQIGLIAEDTAEVFPELAVLKEEENLQVVRNVDYEKLSVILLSEVQKLRREVDDLKHKQ